MTPAYTDDTVTLYAGDCLNVLATLPDASVDAVVTDPPYGLEFMGKDWDSFATGAARIRQPSARDRAPGTAHNASTSLVTRNQPDAYVAGPPFQAWCQLWSAECLRVLKPGGHLLTFGGTRTYHRLACAVEDAGFEIRDSITWLYGSGFPKSLDVGKAIDKARTEDAAPTRAVCALLRDAHRSNPKPRREIDDHFGTRNIGGHWFTPDSPLAQCPTWEQWLWLRDWLGFGDELDAEVWRLNGRKGTPGEAWGMREVLSSRQVPDIRNGHGREYGGAMFAGEETGTIEHRTTAPATDAARQWQGWGTALKPASEPIVVARKPLTGTVAANVLAHGTGALNIDACRVEHDASVNLASQQRQAADTAGMRGIGDGGFSADHRQATYNAAGRWPANVALDDHTAEQMGEPARFFPTFRYQAKAPSAQRPKLADGTAHPTVKPLDLMRWLVRLVTPPGGTVLDPFAGSGTTLEAAALEGFTAVGVERDEAYLSMCRARLAKPVQGGLFGEAVS